MSSEIVKTFNNVNFSIVKEGDDIWWWGGEVATVLGYARHGKAITDHVDEDDKRKIQKLIRGNGVSGQKLTSQNGTSAQNRLCWQINECGLYNLIFNSKLPLAKEFKKWVFTEVLPSIRKTGGYQTPALKHNQLSIISEKDLQYEVIKEIRKRWPHLLLVAPLGELQDTSWKRIDAWKKGYKGGMPDLMIMNSHRYWNGLAIELKNPGGTGVLSEKQKGVLSAYESEGWRTLVCDDLVDCLFEIQEYTEDIVKVCKTCKKMFKTDKSLERHTGKFH